MSRASLTKPVDLRFASLGDRLIAELVDGAVLGIPFSLTLYYFFTQVELPELLPSLAIAGVVVILPMVFVSIFYRALMLRNYGATLGKLLAGIRVERADGGKLSFADALFREVLVKRISSVPLFAGFWAVAFTPKKQAWHDELADTFVIKKESTALRAFLVWIVITAASIGLVVSGVMSLFS